MPISKVAETVKAKGYPQQLQVALIGSCTNSSYLDLMRVASILKGKTVHPTVSLSIAPGSKQVYNMLAKNGALADIIESLDELRYYRKAFMAPVPGPSEAEAKAIASEIQETSLLNKD